jgi:type III restriction enzyme
MKVLTRATAGRFAPKYALYLVRETKGTKDFDKLRNIEADKIRCGKRHFESLGVDFAVVTSPSEI